MRHVCLREVTDDNRGEVLALRLAPEQERFVGTVAGALSDADEIPEGNPWYRAVYAGDEPVGFVMLSWNVAPQPPRIIGPATELLTSCVPGDEGPERFYERLGFVPTGDLDEAGKVILALDLAQP